MMDLVDYFGALEMDAFRETLMNIFSAPCVFFIMVTLAFHSVQPILLTINIFDYIYC